MQRFEDLSVWQRAMDLAERIAEESGLRSSGDGLRGQIRKASTSIAYNIAEGLGRAGDGEFHRFLSIAAGSCAEVQAQLRMAYRGGFMTRERFVPMLHEAIAIGFMIRNLQRRIGARPTSA